MHICIHLHMHTYVCIDISELIINYLGLGAGVQEISCELGDTKGPKYPDTIRCHRLASTCILDHQVTPKAWI